VAGLQERLSRDARSGQEQLMGAVKGELRRAVSALASEESAAIARLDARLAVGAVTAADALGVWIGYPQPRPLDLLQALRHCTELNNPSSPCHQSRRCRRCLN
jgi:hypothetical protein